MIDYPTAIPTPASQGEMQPSPLGPHLVGLPNVAVFGAGIAGLTAAHHLAERGFKVWVFEAAADERGNSNAVSNYKVPPVKLGGLAASQYNVDVKKMRDDVVRVPDQGSTYRSQLIPGEHGFRFFPSYYMHIWDLLKDINVYAEILGDQHQRRPLPNRLNQPIDKLAADIGVRWGRVPDMTVRDNVERVTAQLVTTREGSPSLIIPRSMPETIEEVAAQVDHYRKLGFTDRDIHTFMSRMARYLATSPARRGQELEALSAYDFLVGLDPHSGRQTVDYSAAFDTAMRHMPKVLAAFDCEWGDARTNLSTLIQLQMSSDQPLDKLDGVMRGPTTEEWFDHWYRHLRRMGVSFRRGRLKGMKARRDAHGRWTVEYDVDHEYEDLTQIRGIDEDLQTVLKSCLEADPATATLKDLKDLDGADVQKVADAFSEALGERIKDETLDAAVVRKFAHVQKEAEERIKEWSESASRIMELPDLRTALDTKPLDSDDETTKRLTYAVVALDARAAESVTAPLRVETPLTGASNRVTTLLGGAVEELAGFYTTRPPVENPRAHELHGHVPRRQELRSMSFEELQLEFLRCLRFETEAERDSFMLPVVMPVDPTYRLLLASEWGIADCEIIEDATLKYLLERESERRCIGTLPLAWEKRDKYLNGLEPEDLADLALSLGVARHVHLSEGDAVVIMEIHRAVASRVETRLRHPNELWGGADEVWVSDKKTGDVIRNEGEIEFPGKTRHQLIEELLPRASRSLTVSMLDADGLRDELAHRIASHVGERETFRHRTAAALAAKPGAGDAKAELDELDKKPLDALKKLSEEELRGILERGICIDEIGVQKWDRFQTLSGIQYYFDTILRFIRGHEYYTGTPWALTSINQTSLWKNRPTAYRNSYATILSVDIGDWNTPSPHLASPEHPFGKAAKECTDNELAEEVWRQIKVALANDNDRLRKAQVFPEPMWYNIDNYIKYEGDDAGDGKSGRDGDTETEIDRRKPRAVRSNTAPYLVPIVGDWQNRPGGYPWNPMGQSVAYLREDRAQQAARGVWMADHGGYEVYGDAFVFAGTWTRTFTRMTTMESAVESARHAVNALIDHWVYMQSGYQDTRGVETSGLRYWSQSGFLDQTGLEPASYPTPAGSYCRVFDLENREQRASGMLEAVRVIDEYTNAMGTGHVLDLMGMNTTAPGVGLFPDPSMPPDVRSPDFVRWMIKGIRGWTDLLNAAQRVLDPSDFVSPEAVRDVQERLGRPGWHAILPESVAGVIEELS